MPVKDDRDAIQYSLRIKSLKSSAFHLLYSNLYDAVLQLLAIPVSNADSERVFSLVRRLLHLGLCSSLVAVGDARIQLFVIQFNVVRSCRFPT